MFRAAVAKILAQNVIESVMWNKKCTISSAYDTEKCILFSCDITNYYIFALTFDPPKIKAKGV